MARHQIEFKMLSGATIVAEVDESESAGPRPAGAGESAIERATVSLDLAISRVRPFAELLLKELSDLTTEPEQLSVEFGIKLNVSAGVLIANTAAEGNCKITLNWKKNKQA